jgi:hypothetical protein
MNQLPRIAILLAKAFIYRFLTIDDKNGPMPIGKILTTIKRGVFDGVKFYMKDFMTPGTSERGDAINPSSDENWPITNQMLQICQSLISELGGSVTESRALASMQVYYAQPDKVDGPDHIIKVSFKYILECFFASTRLAPEPFIVETRL